MAFGQRGRFEQIIFADETITDAQSLSSLEAMSPRQAKLAKAAPRLAREARALHDRFAPADVKAGRSGAGTRAADLDPSKGRLTSNGKKAEKAKHGAKPKHRERKGVGKHRRHRRR